MTERFDYLIYDLHSGRLDDLEFGIKGLLKKPLEQEKTLIVISSVLGWALTPHKIVEDKPEPIDPDNVDNPDLKDNTQVIHNNEDDNVNREDAIIGDQKDDMEEEEDEEEEDEGDVDKIDNANISKLAKSKNISEKSIDPNSSKILDEVKPKKKRRAKVIVPEKKVN